MKVLLARYVWGQRLREQTIEQTDAALAVQEPEIATHP